MAAEKAIVGVPLEVSAVDDVGLNICVYVD